MKTNNAEKIDIEPNIKRETFRMPVPAARSPRVSPAQGTQNVVNCFNSILANEFALFTKTLNFHWNVTGPRFHSMHQFLGEQYHELLKVVDGVAERIREIGGNPIGTLVEMQMSTSLAERPGEQPRTSNMIADLVSDHETIQVQIKAALKDLSRKEVDPGSEDFLTSLLKKHEEMAWMLKSHIEK